MAQMNAPEPNEDFESLPPKLREAFQALRKEQMLVPERVDETVRMAARRHLPQRTGRVVFLRLLPLAAAAGLMLACLGLWQWQRRSAPPVQVAAVRGDLDGNGRVDILDAFALARRLQGNERGQGLDANGDGVADEQDVQLLAALAVKLEGAPL
jgi:hypothetical protein